MSFSETFKTSLGPASRVGLRKPLVRALAGLLGLALLPFLSGVTGLAGQGLRILAALAAASALAYLALRWLARRDPAAGGAAVLRIVARTSLSPKNSLALVEADGRRFFIAYGEGFTELLSSAPSVASGEAGGAR